MSSTRTNNSFFLGAVAAVVVALVAAMAALLLLAYNANPARAAGSCATNSGTTTCTYGSTGAEDTFVVPKGVSTIHVVATGAPGAAGQQGGAAGRGAVVSGDLTGLTAGDTLYVNVGGAPIGGRATNCARDVACIGGFNGGGSAYVWGGGGGGASDVRTQPRTVPLASDDSRLIVAAGGGGGGSGDGGGKGGDAGTDGGDGSPGTGGKAGTQSAGGAGGSPDGFEGVLGRGGDANFESEGGGGGGGLYGGGSGDFDCGDYCASGGGGGGSNLVPQGGSATLTQDTTVAPSVSISYKAGGVGEEPPPTEQPQSKEECKKGGYEEFGFKNQGRCIKAVNHAS
jgi:hypothetical protein